MRMDFYRALRHIMPDKFQKWISGYDFSGEEIQNLVQQNPEVIYTQILDLSVAQATPLEINVPGHAVVIYGINAANVYDPTTNLGLEQVEPSAMVACYINQFSPSRLLPLKHNRGYQGTFGKVYLTWPAQTLTSARLVIFRYDGQPWICQEGDNRFGGTVQGTKIVTEANNALVANTREPLFELVNTKRKISTIYNTSTTDTVWVGDITVAVGSGTPILPGGYLYWKNTAILYAISSGTPTLAINTEY